MDKKNSSNNKADDSTQARWGNLMQGQWSSASHGPYSPQGPLRGYALTTGNMVPNPTSLSSLAIGVLNRGENAYLLQYMESEIFKSTLGKIKERTNIDVVVLLAAGLALQKAKKSITELMISIMDHFKQQATSSVKIGKQDSTKYNGILRLSAEKTSSNCSSWLKYGKADRFFWHKNTFFSPEVFGPEKNGDKPTDNGKDKKDNNEWGNALRCEDPSPQGHLIVWCFVNSLLPIRNLLIDVDDRFVKNKKLSVTKIIANEDPESIQREKRALATIDMEPEKLDAIREDVEAFFDKNTRVLCRDTGTPYRRGYLLHGPPGTGKSSLSVAVPLHVNKAFSSLPYRCVVLIEDIDCPGAEVGKRDEQPGQASHLEDEGDAKIDENTALNFIETAMENFILQQNKHNEEMLQRFTDAQDQGARILRHRRSSTQAKLPEAPKKVTLSGLLNVIDNATAAEGRLLITTSNHPEKLDKALLRKGRVDRHFELGYATKITAELTFNRIFGQDTRKRHTMAAINRFAKAFSAQFPTYSEVTTATPAHYCMQYQRRPCEAVRDFAKYLELGDDMWVYSIAKPQNVPKDRINVPEAFDQEMLELRPVDFCRKDAIPKDLVSPPTISKWRRERIQAQARRCGLISHDRAPADEGAQAVSDHIFEFSDEEFDESEDAVSLRSMLPSSIPTDSPAVSSNTVTPESSTVPTCTSASTETSSAFNGDGEATPPSGDWDGSLEPSRSDDGSPAHDLQGGDSDEEDGEGCRFVDALEYIGSW
ncbi:SpoVK, ATPasesAAA+ class [Pyrenophora tritici-repentis]|nr:SpoVK, ATPasesAAA+ class [Pyrenophora tritici-repentis]